MDAKDRFDFMQLCLWSVCIKLIKVKMAKLDSKRRRPQTAK